MSDSETILAAIQNLEQRLREEISSVSRDVATVTQRVDAMSQKGDPEESQNGSSSSKRPEDRSWADRTRDLPSEYANDLSYFDSTRPTDVEIEDEEQDDVLELSEDTLAVVRTAWSAPLTNGQRREMRNRYPVPDTVHTKTPKLDEIFSSSESQFSKNAEAKQTDKDILLLQAHTLDIARPLLGLLEAIGKPDSLSQTDIKMAATDALRLLGNSVYQMSRLRRKRVLKACNPDMANLADDHEMFKEAAPKLFGTGFEKNIKDRAEALKVLHKHQVPRQGGQGARPFFRQNRPSYPQRGGGFNSRGRGSQRFNPMGSQRPFRPNRAREQPGNN